MGRCRNQNSLNFKEPEVKVEHALFGGSLRSAVVVTTDRPDKEYVQLKKTSPWLCEACTGESAGRAPLKRTRLLETFKASLDEGGEAPQPDKMAALRGAKRPSPALAGIEPGCKRQRHIRLPEVRKTFASEGVPEPWRLWRPKGTDQIWLHKGDLPNVVKRLHAEWVAKGVPEIDEAEQEDSSGSKESGGIWFDRRGLAWQGRATDSTGKVHRITKCVPQRDDQRSVISPSDFLLHKAKIEAEIKEWKRDILGV